ncbi:NAD(P)H-quinone oxidoreductase subunit 5 chloroplastic [Bienertia sinuspersici]
MFSGGEWIVIEDSEEAESVGLFLWKVLFRPSLALAQKGIKRSLAYSTLSQLGYMMLALSMGSNQVALFHLITHAYSKALLFLGLGSLIHSMETFGISTFKKKIKVEKSSSFSSISLWGKKN